MCHIIQQLEQMKVDIDLALTIVDAEARLQVCQDISYFCAQDVSSLSVFICLLIAFTHRFISLSFICPFPFYHQVGLSNIAFFWAFFIVIYIVIIIIVVVVVVVIVVAVFYTILHIPVYGWKTPNLGKKG